MNQSASKNRKKKPQQKLSEVKAPEFQDSLVLTVQPPLSTRSKLLKARIYLNSRTIREHKFSVGQPVFISGEGNSERAAVCSVWPSNEVPVTSCEIDTPTREDCDVGLGDKVVVSVIGGPVTVAMKVEVMPLKPSSNLQDINSNTQGQIEKTFVMAHLVGRYIQSDTIFEITQCGTKTKYKVASITGNHDTKQKSVFHVTPDTQVVIMANNQSQPTPIQPEAQSTGEPPQQDSLEFSCIGGLGPELAIIREIVMLPLKHPDLFHHFGLRPPRGLLMFGPPGTGKTLIARVLAQQLQASVFVINGPEITSKFFGESEEKLRDIFSKAAASAPSLIFIDEIDALAPKRELEFNSTSKRIVGTLLTLMDGLGAQDQIVVLGATNQPDSLDIALRRPGRFDREVEIGIPSQSARTEILKVYLNKMPHALTPQQIDTISSSCHGFVGADLAQLCKQAALTALRDAFPGGIPTAETIQQTKLDTIKVDNHHFEAALNQVQPSAMREISIDIPSVAWEDIGGYHDVKQQLREAVEWPLKFPEKFQEFGIKPPRGILLYGPPGCSKTLFAKAVATEGGLNFIPIKGPELFSKYVGDSEKAVRDVFRKARAASPSDEIDALAIERGMGDGTSVQDRVLSQMLNELDGISPLNNVLFLAATNRPDIIDKALMRPGRIDRILYVPLPDSKARQQIFQISLSKMKLAKDVDPQVLTAKTEGYTGAEIVQVCSEAALHALRVNFSTTEISMNDFYSALSAAPPRTTKEQIQFFTSYHQK